MFRRTRDIIGKSLDNLPSLIQFPKLFISNQMPGPGGATGAYTKLLDLLGIWADVSMMMAVANFRAQQSTLTGCKSIGTWKAKS